MDRMEKELGHCGANDDTRVFFRGNRSAQEIVKEASETEFIRFTDPHHFEPDLDTSNGCSESCEVFADT